MKTHPLMPHLLLAAWLASAAGASAQLTTAFTYQGRLNDGSNPAVGSYDLRCALFNAPAAGSQQGPTLTNAATVLSNGLFTLSLDFGNRFDGSDLWLEISVRTNGGSSFVPLSPRQHLTPSPYAVFAGSASNLTGRLSTAQLSGALANSQLANSVITVNAGPGLSGGGLAPLGGAVTLNNTGVLSVAGNADITVSTVNGAVTLGDTATSANTASTMVKRDAGGSFSAGSLTLAGNLNLPAASASQGIIYSDGNLLMHADASGNFFAGTGAGNLSMTGTGNSGVGAYTLFNNTSGEANTALGNGALFYNATGRNNTANGLMALYFNTSGSYNLASGYGALLSNTNGQNNTASGTWALSYNTSGSYNVASGGSALYHNLDGVHNTASGYDALFSNTSGNANAAQGDSALFSNTNGSANTAEGYQALYSNRSGTNNIAQGYQAGWNIVSNNNIDLGNQGTASDNGIIRIGTPGTHSATYLSGVVYGNGAGLTNLNAGAVAGTFTGNVVGAASSATNFSGSLSGDVTGSQTATVVSAVGGQTATAVAGAAQAANAATSASTAGTLVKRDSGGSFSAGSLTLAGNLNLPAASASQGIIYSGNSLLLHADGNANFFAGVDAGNLFMTGTGNSGLGADTLFNNTSGEANTALGCAALYSNVDGRNNTANGYLALYFNTRGSYNTASGFEALAFNTNGQHNTASGAWALYSNTSGAQNVASGSSALYHNLDGSHNTASGYGALFSNTSGNANAGQGDSALYSNTNGAANTAEGYQALYSNRSGNTNIALGYQAGWNIVSNNNIDLGNQGTASDNGIIRLGTPGTHTATYLSGVVYGNGAGLTNLSAGALAGTFSGNVVGAASSATNFTGSLSGDVTGSQTATVVSAVGGQTAAAVAGAAQAANAATSANTASTIVKRDAGGSFSAGSLTLAGNLNLPTATASQGILYSGGSSLLHADASGNFYVGINAGSFSTSNYYNTAIGPYALRNTTTGARNTAHGYQALYSDTGGGANAADGYQALYSNTIGNDNSAFGYQALYSNVDGENNSAVGYLALYHNTSADYNTAHGYEALYQNTTGAQNTAAGAWALQQNTTGTGNTAQGEEALAGNGSGNYNTAVGFKALSNNGSGTNNIGLGYLAGKSNSSISQNNIDIGHQGNSSDTGVIRLGTQGLHTTTYLVGNVAIGPTSASYLLTMSGGAYCNGTQWQNASDRNLKENFQPADPRAVLDQVARLPLALWNYKSEAPAVKHLGPTAQDFRAAFHLGDSDRSIGTVDEGGVALAAIQGLNQKVDELKAQLDRKEAENAQLKARLERLERLLDPAQ